MSKVQRIGTQLVTTVDESAEVARNVLLEQILMTGVRLAVTQGRWVNVKTNDNNVSSTIMGYYADA